MIHTSRKTVSIDALIEYANGYLASDYEGGDSAEAVARRTGLINMIEQALVSANRYRGYSYLDQRGITKSKPGIHWLEKGHSFENTDSTRRRYA
jgi:hypothetical protein